MWAKLGKFGFSNLLASMEIGAWSWEKFPRKIFPGKVPQAKSPRKGFPGKVPQAKFPRKSSPGKVPCWELELGTWGWELARGKARESWAFIF